MSDEEQQREIDERRHEEERMQEQRAQEEWEQIAAFAAQYWWQPMDSAPKDGTSVLLLTSDFGVIEGWWDVSVENFYKSRPTGASYDPENMQGDWVSAWEIGNPGDSFTGDRRLYCGATPHAWMPKPADPPKDSLGLFSPPESPHA